MYKSYVYLETRVLLSAVPGVFVIESEESHKSDILTAKADFLRKNNLKRIVNKLSIQPTALRKATLLAHALNSQLLEESYVEYLTGDIQEPPDDKNFTGYSIVVATGGALDIMFHQKEKSIKIEEIRIEEDCGRLTRTGGKAHMDWTYAGCPSIRIRTSTCIELGEEAELFLSELYTLMAYLKLTTGEQGESCIRSNAYISLAEYPSLPDYFIKLRNLNSFNFVRKAINSELSRQEEILSSGGKIASESRLWAEEQNVTESFQPRKEDIIRFEKVKPAVVVKFLPQKYDNTIEVELPAERRKRIRKQYGLSRLRADFICAEKDRADYFEQSVSEGADPLMTSHWIASELTRILNRNNIAIKQSRLTPQKFACIIKMLSSQKIHSGIAKSLIQTVCSTGEDPEQIVENSGKILLSKKEQLLPFIKKVLKENEGSVNLIKNGDMAPLEYLTGCVMKLTDGCAIPLNVKKIIKDELKISVVYVLTMGGAITAQKQNDGTICAGDANTIKTMLGKTGEEFPVQITPLCPMLSEETEPADWAKLIAEIENRIESGTANGIVVTHGTDTLSYTAALLFWLFGSSSVPIVLTASGTLPSESDEAVNNLLFAVKTARGEKNGVYVVYNKQIYSPLNLKFIGEKNNMFVNWNLSKPQFTTKSVLSQQFNLINSPESETMSELFNEASSRLSIIRLFPGQSGSRLEKQLKDEPNVDNVILELYSAGTGNMRNSDYSIKPLLLYGRKRGCRFMCTSQQECNVNFSQYSTSARVWREGAIPMGVLTTESTVALFFASFLIADNETELGQLIDNAVESVEE